MDSKYKSLFDIEYKQQGHVAPGMSASFSITFYPRQRIDFESFIQAEC